LERKIFLTRVNMVVTAAGRRDCVCYVCLFMFMLYVLLDRDDSNGGVSRRFGGAVLYCMVVYGLGLWGGQIVFADQYFFHVIKRIRLATRTCSMTSGKLLGDCNYPLDDPVQASPLLLHLYEIHQKTWMPEPTALGFNCIHLKLLLLLMRGA